jgi:hypothetical protein
MKIRREFLQETITIFSTLYGRTISQEEAEEIIYNCLSLLETLGDNTQRQCGEPYYEIKQSPLLV